MIIFFSEQEKIFDSIDFMVRFVTMPLEISSKPKYLPIPFAAYERRLRDGMFNGLALFFSNLHEFQISRRSSLSFEMKDQRPYEGAEVVDAAQ